MLTVKEKEELREKFRNGSITKDFRQGMLYFGYYNDPFYIVISEEEYAEAIRKFCNYYKQEFLYIIRINDDGTACALTIAKEFLPDKKAEGAIHGSLMRLDIAYKDHLTPKSHLNLSDYTETCLFSILSKKLYISGDNIILWGNALDHMVVDLDALERPAMSFFASIAESHMIESYSNLDEIPQKYKKSIDVNMDNSHNIQSIRYKIDNSDLQKIMKDTFAGDISSKYYQLLVWYHTTKMRRRYEFEDDYFPVIKPALMPSLAQHYAKIEAISQTHGEQCYQMVENRVLEDLQSTLMMRLPKAYPNKQSAEYYCGKVISTTLQTAYDKAPEFYISKERIKSVLMEKSCNNYTILVDRLFANNYVSYESIRAKRLNYLMIELSRDIAQYYADLEAYNAEKASRASDEKEMRFLDDVSCAISDILSDKYPDLASIPDRIKAGIKVNISPMDFDGIDYLDASPMETKEIMLKSHLDDDYTAYLRDGSEERAKKKAMGIYSADFEAHFLPKLAQIYINAKAYDDYMASITSDQRTFVRLRRSMMSKVNNRRISIDSLLKVSHDDSSLAQETIAVSELMDESYLIHGSFANGMRASDIITLYAVIKDKDVPIYSRTKEKRSYVEKIKQIIHEPVKNLMRRVKRNNSMESVPLFDI